MTVYLGTTSGVWGFDRATGRIERLGLEAHRIWALYARTGDVGETTLLAGSYGSGMFRSSDGGASWSASNAGLTAAAFRTLQRDPFDRTAILAGTEPARVFRSADTGASWHEFETICELSGVEDWFLPYSPRAGAVRNFAASANGTLYASVEVGGLLVSSDRGAIWELLAVDPGPRVHDDVHQVLIDPIDDAIIVALGGALVDRTHGEWLMEPRQIGGVAVSRDDGMTWTKLLPHYTRAVHIPSTSTDWLIAGPAARTNEGGWVVGTRDRGASWEPLNAGIDTPLDDMVERFVETPEGEVWALCSGGRVFASVAGDWQWQDPFGGAARNLVVESVAFPEPHR